MKLVSVGGVRAEGIGLAASLATAIGAWGLGAGFRTVGLPFVAVGAVGLVWTWLVQAEASRRAAALGGADASERPSLLTSLARVAARLEAVEHRLTNHHPVTGLATREPLIAAMADDRGVDGRPRLLGAIRFVDFDRLASFDEAAANAALAEFARRLSAATGPEHLVGQIDRDCFAIWFKDDDLAAAEAEFRSLVYVASQEIFGEGGVLTPTIEAGLVQCPPDGADPGQLVMRAAAALATPLSSATGMLTLAEPRSAADEREAFALEQDLAQAIAEDQLTMVFQPVVDLGAGRLIGAEALLRWEHPTLGAISPARFIPVVEQIGLSERYGLWVLNTACRQARRWRDQGLVGLKVAVNLSARQLLDPDLPSKIERTVIRHGLEPRALELELTETAAMADATRTRMLFTQLRATGVSISIDDFGSGYSSLSYLKNLPFDKLKIDREFVTDVDKRRDSRAICKALIELGRGLDLVVLAEGVESAPEVETLRSLGCEVFQGYFVSRPLSGEDFLRQALDPDWLARLVPGAAPIRHRLRSGLSA